MEKIDIIKEELKQILSEKRYIHSIGVMEMAMELAQIYNIDIEKFLDIINNVKFKENKDADYYIIQK